MLVSWEITHVRIKHLKRVLFANNSIAATMIDTHTGTDT